MNGVSQEAARVEESRIQAAYARRSPQDDRYSWFDGAHLFLIQQLEREVLSLLRLHGIVSLDSKKILEVGCGWGHWLREFIKWGARPEHLTGVELVEERVNQARRLCPAAVTIEHASASALNFPDAHFDIVLQATVFTSILDCALKKQIAAEMARVVRKDGIVLWYDFHLASPWNSDVRGVKKAEIQELFAGCKVDLRRITLAPPVTRLLAPYSWLACYLLEKVPWLCTHYLGAIRANPRAPEAMPAGTRRWRRRLQTTFREACDGEA